MNGIGKYLAEELLKEIEEIKDYVVVYSGRFQPFHRGHYATYEHLVKKFGKSNVYIGTSDKTDKLKSPFNFKEKREIMTKMFGIPSNRIIQIKNPYAPTEILKNYDETSTAFITVVGGKDASRLGGKYFTPYKGNLEVGYKDKGYVYISPSLSNVSGTDVRNWLGSGDIENRKKLFTKAYPKFDSKIFNLITKKLDTLNERIFIPKEVIEYWASNRLDNFLKEVSLSNAGGVDTAKDVDDGPNFFFPNYDTFDIVSKHRAERIGYTLFRQIMSKELEDYYEHPIYPNGPVKAVTPFPAGVIGATTATNQKDFFGDDAYEKWYRHVTRSMGLAGYDVVKGLEDISKELSIQSADNIKKAAGVKRSDITIVENGMGISMGYPSKEQLAQKKKERDVLRKKMDSESEYYKKVDEDITIPLNVGDTILGGKFKNKKIVVKDIGKNEKGEITVNGKPLLKYRLIDEAYSEAIAELMTDVQFEELLSEIPMDDLQQINKFADKQLNPIDIVITDRHFLDRLTDPRNRKPISAAELIGFFKRLAKKKDQFVDFLKKYGEIVAKDNRTKINIPFMKQANKAIAKTIMRKDDFKTPSPELKFELKLHSRIIEGIGDDFGNTPYVVDLEDLTKSNSNYRTTKWTGKKLQMTLMSIDDEIGLEVHNEGDQFLRVEDGEGKVLMGRSRDNLDIEEVIEDDYAIFIPAGYYHNIINTGDTPLKLYAIYAPIEHPKGRIDKIKPVNEDTVKHISKSLGVSRKDMPQINSKDVGEFVTYLKDKGVSVSSSVINVSKVGMTQKDINVDKVRDLLGVEKANLAKPVIISKDNYILDGHHRVAALYNIDKDFRLKTIKVDLGIGDLLKTAKGFPKVSYKNINESSDISPLGGGNNSSRWTPPGKAKKLGVEQLSGYTQTDFPIADSMDISGEKDSWISQSKTAKYNNKVKAKRDSSGNLVLERKLNEGDNRTLLEGGSYGHMAHPFDLEINLTFGQLKDIVKKALNGELELTREKTDGVALAVSWVNGRLVAARNKSHLKDRGKGAMDINGVASKFANRGGLTDAYNFAMKDLSAAIDKLSQKQKDKIFGGGSKFMNLEVIYPESVNVIPYGQALLVFHGTFEYDEAGNIIGEDQSAGRVLAGMIKQINQNVQSKYTIQGPPVTKLPKNKELSKLQPKYFGMISKLQSEFGLKDNQGVAEYHQKWWENFVNKNAPTLDAQQKIGLVKRWAFMDKSFRLKEIGDEKLRKWAEKIDKEDQSKISKENLMKFERIFLGVGADVLSFMSSVLTVNPDKAKRAMVDRLEKTIKDVEAKGSEAQIAKLKLELQRIADLGGFEKLVPNEGIVFQYPSGPNGYTMKLTGFFAPANQLLGIFFDNR
jgi:mannose-6-phosphate isomerase-like protein (cupin superfamily)